MYGSDRRCGGEPPARRRATRTRQASFSWSYSSNWAAGRSSTPLEDREAAKYAGFQATRPTPEAQPLPPDRPSFIEKAGGVLAEPVRFANKHAFQVQIHTDCLSYGLGSGCQIASVFDNDLGRAASSGGAWLGGGLAGKLAREACVRACPAIGSRVKEVLPRLGDETGSVNLPGGGGAKPGSGAAQATPTGLRDASPGLRNAFDGGSIRDRSIIGVRSALTESGFARQQLTTNRSGYRFDGPGGEQVRIMRRGGGWEVRVQNRDGNYLDEWGTVASPQNTHGITLRSR
jgi:hypothetical protein